MPALTRVGKACVPIDSLTLAQLKLGIASDETASETGRPARKTPRAPMANRRNHHVRCLAVSSASSAVNTSSCSSRHARGVAGCSDWRDGGSGRGHVCGLSAPWAFVYKLVFRKRCRCAQAEKKSTSFLPVAPSKPRSLHLAIVVRLVLTTAGADCDPSINPSAAAPASIPSTTLTFFLKRYPGLEPTILLLTNTNSLLFPLLLQSLDNRQHARPHAAVCRFGRRWPCHAAGQ